MRNKIKNKMLILLSFLLVLSWNFCLLNKKNPNLQAFINHDKKDFHKSSIIIYNFMAPNYDLHAGKIAKVFKVISKEDNFPWDLSGDSEEEKIIVAMVESKKWDITT